MIDASQRTRLGRILGLITLPQVGNSTLRALARAGLLADTVEYATLLTRLVVVGGLRTAQRRALEEGLLRDGGAQAEARGRDQLAEVERVGADVLVLGDSDYPARLASIVDAPPIMFARGRREPDTRAVACVGTRSPTDFGRTAALRLSETLAREGWTVVSGLALGIDTVAHEAALAVGGRTVAVLGNA